MAKRQVSVVERRLKDPFGMPNMHIPSKPKGAWAFHIFNSEVTPNRTYLARHHLGWEFASEADIDGKAEDYGFEVRDGRLVMGLKGQEWLGKMPMADYQAVQKSKATQNLTSTLGSKGNKASIVEGAAGALGDEAASYLHKSLHRMEVEDSIERVPLDDN